MSCLKKIQWAAAFLALALWAVTGTSAFASGGGKSNGNSSTGNGNSSTSNGNSGSSNSGSSASSGNSSGSSSNGNSSTSNGNSSNSNGNSGSSNSGSSTSSGSSSGSSSNGNSGNSNGNSGSSNSGSSTSSGSSSGSSSNGNGNSSNSNGNSGSSSGTSSGSSSNGNSGNSNGNSGNSNGNSGNSNGNSGNTIPGAGPCIPSQTGCLGPSPTTINLFTTTSSGSSNGAVYSYTTIQPTGTGVIKPFLRVQSLGNNMGGVQQGYNADYSHSYQPNFDEKTGIWTHSVPLSSLVPVTINGTSYFQFLLDVNQIGASQPNSVISLNSVRIFSSPVADPANGSNVSGLGSPIFNMDIGPNGDTTVNIDYALGHGSGSGDMYMYVPVADFAGHSGFMIFYSSFGVPFGSNAGFEEWTVLTNPNQSPRNPVPEPGSLFLFGTGLLGLAGIVRRRIVR